MLKMDVGKWRTGSSQAVEQGIDKSWAGQKDKGQKMLPEANVTESKT